jgi:hypothetical protein
MNDLGPFGDLALRQYLAEHMKIVFSYTHAVVIEKTGIGTGVAFRLGERLFLITAGHNLTKRFEVKLFAQEGPAITAEILSSHFHPDSLRDDVHRDFGFIEIENIPSLPACQVEQFDIGEPTPRVVQDGLWFVAGCPESGFLPPNSPGQIGLAVVSGFLRGGNEVSVEIDYARTGHSIAPDGSFLEESDFFATPKGFSGGGVWVLPKPAEGQLFVPHKHVKLCGTQCGWNKRERFLRAMRPRFTLPHFFEWYPELKADYGHVLKSSLNAPRSDGPA